MKARALTLKEARQVHASDNPDAVLLSLAYGIEEAAAAAWLDKAPAGAALARINAAWEASNATDDAGFPAPAAGDVGVAREAQ